MKFPMYVVIKQDDGYRTFVRREVNWPHGYHYEQMNASDIRKLADDANEGVTAKTSVARKTAARRKAKETK